MGIVVCIVMLLGLVVLRPTPWRQEVLKRQSSVFNIVTGLALFFIGGWNMIYGFLQIQGFWHYVSLLSGLAMVIAAIFVLIENTNDIKHSRFRSAVIGVLALSFLLYFITIVQLNLGVPILR